MNRLLIAALIATALAYLLLWAGNMDYQENLVQEQHYIKMVCEGHWPDYRNMKPECEK